MFESISSFFTSLWHADFGFGFIWDFIVSTYNSATSTEGVSDIWAAIGTALAPAAALIPFILIALSLIVAFFGKKILPLLKFLGFFFFGFLLGASLVTPVISAVVPMPAWICGLVIAIVLAVLYRLVYYLIYIFAILYSSYVIFYTGFTLQPQTEHNVTKALTCLAVAIIVLVLAFIFKKYVEMAYTSALGGFLTFTVINTMLFELTSLEALSYTPWVFPLVITLAVAIPGLVVQVKQRKRYY